MTDIEIFSASAGTGKTFRLVHKLVDSIGPGSSPERVLATTFTNKAAAELIERVRYNLFEKGLPELAQRILDGYLGTVNSVCGRLLREFALECGLSPVQDVLPEGDDQFLFERSIASVVEKYSKEIAAIALRLGMKERTVTNSVTVSTSQHSSKGEDWRDTLKTIINQARQNNIDPQDLTKSASRSWETLKQVLSKPLPHGQLSSLDDNLTMAIEKAYEEIRTNGDATKGTRAVLDKLEIYVRKGVHATSLSWHDWVELSSKLSPGKASLDAYQQIVSAAEYHSQHPRFHDDLKRFIRLIFKCAAEAMHAFSDFKKKHGLVDFVDQEKLTLDLLKNPQIRRRLKDNLDLVLVDEFQDTNPIQLALFLEFANLTKKSIWVGDQKQAIYGFRGTDPVLMDAVIEKFIGLPAVEVLSDSYRARPGLVAFTNAVFEEAFAPLGIPPERVRLTSKIEDGSVQMIPLHVWRLLRENQAQEAQSLASALNKVLGMTNDYLLVDKESKQTRPLRPCDIAVLCRTGAARDRVAEALEASGIRVTIPRVGLLSTPECVLGFASLRYLVDAKDTLAKAEILHYLLEKPNATPAWFKEWLEPRNSRSGPTNPVIDELDGLRSRLIHLTPTEALEAAFKTVKIYEAALRWGDGTHRLANIEMLRGLSSHYEDQCLINRSAGTPAGLVTFLRQNIQGGEMDTQPQGQDEHAVQVLTYHGAKGLEWPMVIMFELNWNRPSWPFGTHVSSDQQTFDPMKPLDGRWIRYWPWPYGAYTTGVGLDVKVKESPQYQEVSQQELREAIRLLYVGMTRARDYLIFAPGIKVSKKNPAQSGDKETTRWLDLLKSKDDKKILHLPRDPGEQSVTVGGQCFKMYVEEFQPLDAKAQGNPHQTYITPTTYDRGQYHPSAKLVPSQQGGDLIQSVSVANTVRLGNRIPIPDDVDMELLGGTIHAFFAIDDRGWDDARRLEMAEQILANWKVTAVNAESLVKASNSLRSHVEQRYGTACVWHREWPMHLRKDNQKAKGWIDLLLKTSEGYVIVDHKSFPGSMDKWADKAIGYAPQLALYREAVEKATQQPVIATMIHMPVLGVLLELRTD